VSTHLIHALSELPLLEELPPERLSRLAASTTLRTFERGERMLGPSDAGSRTSLVVAGAARLSRVSGDGRSIAVGILDAGDVFGQLPFGEASEGERVEAIDRCTVARIPTADLEQLALEEPSVARVLVGDLGRRSQAVACRLEALAFQQVPARFATALIELSERYGKVTATGVRLDVRITHGQLAELVGTTRETLTKVAGWLRAEGIASLERRQIWITNYGQLEEVAAGTHVMPGRTERGLGNGNGHGSARALEHREREAVAHAS
jgi:CRP-like cAMP-binding protein